MADWQPIPLATHSAQAKSATVSLERLRNMFVAKTAPNSKSPVVLYPTPGLLSWSSVGNGPIRGIHEMDGALWVVSGESLYVIDVNKAETLIGTVQGSGNVWMADNGVHVVIAASQRAYAANMSEIIELPQQNLNGATYQDGYGIFSQAQTENFWLTNLDDMTTISALDFSTADAFADTMMGCISDHRELILFGKKTIERWSNVGAASFPFVRSGGGFHERGCAAPGSIAKALNQVFFEGDDLKIHALGGGDPQVVSTPEIERLIAATADPHSAWGYTYTHEGHTFYVLTYSDLTIVFDLTTGAWHERKSHDIDRWRANGHAFAWDKHIVGDYANGNLYELSPTTYSDNTAVIRREIVTPPIHAGPGRLAIHELRLEIEAGVGLVSGQGSDPQVMLDWSDDDGHTWSNERWTSLGALGNRRWVANWTRLGTCRNRTFRFAVTDPVNFVVLGAYARGEVRL